MDGLIADHFQAQADACEAMGSPFTSNLIRAAMDVLDGTTATGGRILAWPNHPRADALALRLCGALHALVLSGKDEVLATAYPPNPHGDIASILALAIARHDAELDRWLNSPPQTNETVRSSALLPGFLAIARDTGLPLALTEIGSSAGLNLFFDRFRYRYGETDWGDADYPAVLAAELRGPMPDLSGDLSIASRSGNDIAPLDVHEASDRLRLRAYLWPDQTERLERLDAAIAVARAGDFTIDKMDAADFVRMKLGTRRPGECMVLFHSVVWQYLPEETKAAITQAMEDAGAAAAPDMPLAWLRMEGLGGSDPFATLQLTLWPAGETRLLARCDFHARWIEWL